MKNKNPLDEFLNKTTLVKQNTQIVYLIMIKNSNSQEAFFFAVEKNQIATVKELLKRY